MGGVILDIIEGLMKAGFTRHESVLYVTLCREGELTGYEASKISGIPRSNAYLALAGLVEKGGACRIESDAVKYCAVPARELAANIRRNIEEVIKCIIENSPEKESLSEPFINITGIRNIVDKMKNIIDNAAERVYISVSGDGLELVEDELKAAKARGLKVVIITTPGYSIEGTVVYHNDKKPGQVRLITDSSNVLTGEISGGSSANCLYSKNRNLILLIKDSLTNEIKLIEARENKN